MNELSGRRRHGPPPTASLSHGLQPPEPSPTSITGTGEGTHHHHILMPDPHLPPALVALRTPGREQGLLPGVKAAWAGAGREYRWVQLVGGQV